MHKIFWIIVLSLLSVVSAAARYTDCEVAPPVQYATQNVEDDDDTVTVIYTCERGYELRGESKLVCDLDTDEWHGDPPSCERAEHVTSEHVTDTDGNKDDGTISQEETGPTNSQSGKKKGILEADRITSEFANQLDMSCYNPPKVAAPQIKNGHIVTYDRRQKKGHIFLVAVYNCSANYEMEEVTNSILYCSKKSWIGERPVCNSMTDEYGEDYEEEDGEDGDEEEEEIEEEAHRRHHGAKTEEDRIDQTRHEESNTVQHEIENNEIEREQHLSHPKLAEEIKEEITEETPRVFNESCGPDRGGCDHECRMVLYPEEHEPRVVCSCYSGFTLDIYDLRRCQDIDECSQNNGGCEQICTNMPGSYQCSCDSGLQIDTVTGNTCIDINECLLRNGHGPCQDTCHNLWSTYMCTCENLPGTRISNDNHSCEDDGECYKNNGGCSHKCFTIVGRVFCLCPNGFYLSEDWKTCKDIDECSKPNILSLCPYGCENTHGSYRCLEPTRVEEDVEEHSVTQPDIDNEENEIERNVVMEPKLENNCRDGFRLNNQNECIDIDECAEGTTGCEYCQNAQGGFECYCPDGYELSDNEKTCQDINECEVYDDYENGDDENNDGQTRSTGVNTVCSHECVNLIGSYQCKCPQNLHLHVDKRTCIQDYCEDLLNPELNKMPCSHKCIDEPEGFKCECSEGHTLDTDMKTCVTSRADTDSCTKFDGQASCYPGTCVSGGEDSFTCLCPSGYLQKDRRCHDIDECSNDMHQCSNDCINIQGSYECTCPQGLRLSAADYKNCEDLNECQDPDICGEDLICENTYGSYKCVCPEGKEFQSDGKCATHFDACATENGKCSHKCTSQNGYAICDCPEGMVLTEDDNTCIERNPCQENNGGCSQNCDPNIRNVENRCYCNQGYELMSDYRTCMDYDECKENNGGCSQICINLPGSYKCLCKNGFELLNNNLCEDIDECLLELHNCSMDSICVNIQGGFKCNCPDGFAFNKTLNQCLDIDECLLYDNNGNCSHICINLPGSFQCSCPIGQVLINDEKTCQFIDECQLNNGGCSHNCHYSLGIVTCLCPNGYRLDNSSKNCIDIDECSIRNGRCTHKCENYLGHYKCLCPYGYALNGDSFTCSDIDECIENNGNCSNICINLLGSYSCTCEIGFELEPDLHTCIDVNECTQNLHDCSHLCINIPGSYDCSCPAGYEIGAESKFVCVDINECERTTNGGCSHRCTNTLGGYNCDCPPGHSLTEDNRTCAILNECNAGERKCSHNCENRIGGYECLCPAGLRLAHDDATCIDINECDEENGRCSHICENAEGSFSCHCPDGYKLGEDSSTCFDIDECQENNGGCNHYCQNFGGGFKCDCAPNYVLANNGKTCQSENFCNLNNGGCQQICESTSRGAQCSCRPGFILDSNNATCIDIDECRYSNTCQQECRNTIGSFECRCHSGYTKDGLGQCIDVNECEFLNGGCSENSECINLPGSVKCTCYDGFKLAADKKTCFEIKDYCMPLKPPRNGEIHCTRSRHKTQLYYKTKCSVWCHKGFRLEGPSTRHCNGTGEWDEYDNQCIPQTCPPLAKPEYGTILPANCLLGNIFAGERCLLHCPSGYIPTGKRAAICNVDQTWSTNSTLGCVPIPLSVPSMPSSFPIESTIPAVATSRTTSGVIKPYIKCPQDTILILPTGQKTVFIRLEQPKTNIDYFKLVDSHPDWAKNLDAHLGAGVHVITFRARSPNSNLNAICKTVITVKEAHPPTVVYCPPSYDIQLGVNERARSLTWKEPVFRSHGHLKQIYKSKVPGEMFSPGVHNILYVATDRDGQSSRCEFKLIVRANQHHQISSPQHGNHHNIMEGSRLAGYKVNGLENHESYLLCPGKESIKIETNYPVSKVRLFYKNLRNLRKKNHSSQPQHLIDVYHWLL